MMLDLWPDQLLHVTSPGDQEMRLLADRHYSRQTPRSPQFTGNGHKLVLRDAAALVLWVWKRDVDGYGSWGQSGYYCQIFRNESGRRSSEIILEAERIVVARWGPGRMYTYVDPAKVRSTNPGYCYLMAGWHSHGYTKRGKRLLVKHDGCAQPRAAPAHAE